MKATDSNAPKLWGLIPVTASPKTVARVELRKAVSTAGVLPLGLPDVNPEDVAAIVVNEDVANWQTTAAAVVGKGFLTPPATKPPGTDAMNVYQGLLTNVNLNGANNFGVFILTSLNSSPPSLSGSLDTICGQSPSPAGQVECFAYDGSGQEVSFIHSYSDASACDGRQPPATRGADRRWMQRLTR